MLSHSIKLTSGAFRTLNFILVISIDILIAYKDNNKRMKQCCTYPKHRSAAYRKQEGIKIPHISAGSWNLYIKKSTALTHIKANAFSDFLFLLALFYKIHGYFTRHKGKQPVTQPLCYRDSVTTIQTKSPETHSKRHSQPH